LAPEELRRAIERREIYVCFQPKTSADYRKGTMLGAEALVRWKHPDHGQIPPLDFIPLAEETGLIKDLTWFVIEEAIHQARECLNAGCEIPISVNISPALLSDLTLPDKLSAAAREHNVDCSLLTLEITESATARDFDRAMDILARFRLKGFGLSMDDFGTGYSSLTHLVRLPFNELKIDKSFVLDIGKHKDSETVIRSTVLLAHHLDMTVCAEGVETHDNALFLMQCGVDAIQGYLVSKPLPAREWIEFMAGSSRTRASSSA
jgi:EAL domain-containing protein (putative c-di-GMP-specific phosphodiesterase class I)